MERRDGMFDLPPNLGELSDEELDDLAEALYLTVIDAMIGEDK